MAALNDITDIELEIRVALEHSNFMSDDILDTSQNRVSRSNVYNDSICYEVIHELICYPVVVQARV